MSPPGPPSRLLRNLLRTARSGLRARAGFASVGNMVGRIPVFDVAPVVNLGRHPAKASVGEEFDVTATVFREGHDQLGAEVVLTDADGVRRPPVPMREIPDQLLRMTARVRTDAPGAWSYEIQTWSDTIGTWLHDAGIKIRAGVDVELMFTEGVLVLQRVVAEGDLGKNEKAVVNDAVKALKDTKRPRRPGWPPPSPASSGRCWPPTRCATC